MHSPPRYRGLLVPLVLGTLLTLPACCESVCSDIYQDCLENDEVDVTQCQADHYACLNACDDPPSAPSAQATVCRLARAVR